jgi:hypothetical protein
MYRRRIARIGRNYRRVYEHRYGRWALAAVWGGLMLAGAASGIPGLKFIGYIPLLLEHRALVRAAWEPISK